MPKSAVRACRVCGVQGCTEHRAGWSDPRRGSSSERGYGAGWEKLRRQVLARDAGLCQICLSAGRYRPARHVDHIVPKSAGGSDDPENLQSICPRCHAEKTQAEARAARAARPRAVLPALVRFPGPTRG